MPKGKYARPFARGSTKAEERRKEQLRRYGASSLTRPMMREGLKQRESTKSTGGKRGKKAILEAAKRAHAAKMKKRKSK